MAGGLKERQQQGFYDPVGQTDPLNPADQAWLNQEEAALKTNDPSDKLSDKETAASNTIGDQLRNKYSSLDSKEKESAGFYNPVSTTTSTTKQSFKGFLKKKWAIGGVSALLGGGGIIVFLLGPSSMLVSLHDNLTLSNDASSAAMERRLHRVLKNISKDPTTPCGKSKKIHCHMGRMSNHSLRQMAKKGIKPIFDDGEGAADYKDLKRTGYPDKNPSSYEIDDNGTKRKVKAEELMDFLQKKENRRLASKVLGVSGAFNMRFRAWTGKHIKGRFYDKFKLSRSGNFMKSLKSKTTDKAKDKVNSALEKLAANGKEKFPGVDAAAERFKGHLGEYTSKLKRGGAGYMLLASGCMISKAPKLIGAGIAAYQLSQLLSPVMDIVLSNGSRMKAAGFGSDFGAEDMEIVGNMLTEKTVNEKGRKTSALDSKYLLAALGVNKNKLPVSSKFTPGYATITSSLFQQGKAVEEAVEGSCNVIMSPAMMYSAAAADAAFTIATSTVPIVGTLTKLVASYAISEVIGAVVTKLGGVAAKEALEAFATNNAIPTARGEELGDVLGIGAAAFFSSGAMSRSLPALTVNGSQAFNEMRQETAALQKEMDIASLNPLDMSSRYTFLGNIAFTMRQNLLQSGAYVSPIRSIASLPLSILGSTLSPVSTKAATNFSNEFCGYAKDFSLEGVNGKDPAINMAGLPCTGLTRAQDSMATSEAIDLMIGEGWLDETKDIESGDSIQDLIDKSYIKPDTPLYDFIDSCSDASTGNYLFNAAGCIIDDSEQVGDNKLKSITNQLPKGCTKRDDGSEVCFNGTIDGVDENPAGLNNPRAMAAISVFLLDYQIVQSINGEDGEESGSSNSNSQLQPGAPENVKQVGSGWSLKENTDYSSVPCTAGTTDGGVYEVRIGTETSKIRVCGLKDASGEQFQVASLISENIKQMFEAADKDGIKLTSQSSFRSLAEQQGLYNQNCPGGSCSVQTSPPGNSQHELGLAVDWGVGGRSFCYPASACPGDRGYDWMMKNAQKYGFHKLDSEGWHFSTSGY